MAYRPPLPTKASAATPAQSGVATAQPGVTHTPDRLEPAIADAEGAEPRSTSANPAKQDSHLLTDDQQFQQLGQQQQQQQQAVVRSMRVSAGEHEVTLAADGRKAGAAKRGAAWASDKTRSRLCRAALLRRVCELLDLAAQGADGVEAEARTQARTDVAQAGAPAGAPAGDKTGEYHHRQLHQQGMEEGKKRGWWWTCSYGALKRQLLGGGYSRAWAALRGGPAGSGLFTLWLPKPEGEADFTAAPQASLGSVGPR